MSGQSLILQMRMMLLIVSAVLAGFSVTMSLVTWQASTAQHPSALLYTEQLAQSSAAQVQKRLETTLGTAQTLASTLVTLRAAGKPDRTVATAILRRATETNPGFLGVWSAWESNAFDGEDARYVNAPGSDAKGRFVPYLNRGNGAVQLDATVSQDSSMDTGEWYQAPTRWQTGTA